MFTNQLKNPNRNIVFAVISCLSSLSLSVADALVVSQEKKKTRHENLVNTSKLQILRSTKYF